MNNISLRLLRYAFFLLFAWFGIQQLQDPSAWVGFLPTWTGYLPIPGPMLVQLNGWFEIIASIALLFGVFTRIIAVILSLHLIGIAIQAGGAIGVRDAALAVIGIAIAFAKEDSWTMDYVAKLESRPATPLSPQQ